MQGSEEGAIALTNLKQRGREQSRKLVYVNPDLLGALQALAKDAGVPSTGYFFRSRQSPGQPMSYGAVLATTRRAAPLGSLRLRRVPQAAPPPLLASPPCATSRQL